MNDKEEQRLHELWQKQTEEEKYNSALHYLYYALVGPGYKGSLPFTNSDVEQNYGKCAECGMSGKETEELLKEIATMETLVAQILLERSQNVAMK